MRVVKTYQIENPAEVKHKLMNWAQKFDHVSVLESNAIPMTKEPVDQYGAIQCMVAIGAHSQLSGVGKNDFERLKEYVEDTKDWIFGYLTYDLKNQIEDLQSKNEDYHRHPELHFFQPELICEIEGNNLMIRYLKQAYSEERLDEAFNEILAYEVEDTEQPYLDLQARISKKDYLKGVSGLKERISYGDIYEVNYCQEFFAEGVKLNPINIYERLNAISKTPFASYFKSSGRYLLSASPERFLRKVGTTLVSQPIKGTRRRGVSDDLDRVYREELSSSEKEKSENVMIVDLVRNDLSRSAVKGSVEVEDLFGIYTFEQVHQMISTVKCEIREEVHPIDAIKNASPMGSMTGAPKIKAMELIEEFEVTKRGLYSGAIGYITPDLDFDSSVLIRSILYNEDAKYLSFMVGGAITDLADPEEEYDECQVKAKALFDVLNVNVIVH